MYYVGLWRRFVVLALLRQSEYRVNFLFGLMVAAADLAVVVLTGLVLYRFTPSVAGWTGPEVLVLLGVYRLMDALLSVQVGPNVRALAQAIRLGELDALLLRPLSSQFLVSLRTLDLTAAPGVPLGMSLVIYGGRLAHVNWSPAHVAAATGFGMCGLVLLYAWWFSLVTTTFWLIQASSLHLLFSTLFQTARYPVSFFKGLVREFLTFVVPVAFATTFPATALLGRADLRLLPIGGVLAAFVLALTHIFWGRALRHYSSASS